MASERDKGPTSSKSHARGLREGGNEPTLDPRSSDDPGSRRLDRNEAKKIIQRASEISYIRHCHEELAKDNLRITDVPNVLRCGKILKQPEEKDGAWRYVVETERIAVVVEILSETSIRAITAWRKKR
jgi:hypothetical protein